MVQHVGDDGFIRFTPIGGWDTRLLPSHAMTIITRERRRVEGVIASKPPHILKPSERDSVIHVEDMFLDIGASSRQDVLALGVRVGDPIVIMYPARRIGADTIMSKALDDRAGCGVVIKALEALKGETVDATIYAAFVIAEERGLIGARTAAFSIGPDMAIALEGTVAADSPGIPPQGQPTVQGQGPAITVADGGFVVPRKMVMALEKAAEDNRIPYQTKVPPYGGTDATAIHQTRGGVLTGVISVPCRYIHSPFSTCRLTDFDNTWRLLAAFCRVATTLK
jgi:endoglucanase